MLDLNGDGLSDFVHTAYVRTPAPGATQIRALMAVSPGTWAERVALIGALAYEDAVHWRPMDINGDRMSDLAHIRARRNGPTSCLDVGMLVGDGAGGWRHVMYGDGAACLAAAGPEDASLLEDANFARSADLNADGLTDLYHVSSYRDSGGILRSAFISMLNLPTSGGQWRLTRTTLDSIGQRVWMWQPWQGADGRPGLLYATPPNPFDVSFAPFIVAVTWDTATDDMTHTANGLGATTRIDYVTLAGHREYLPSGTLLRVVGGVEVTDAAYDPAIVERVTYTYDGARHSDVERRLLGFSTRTATRGLSWSQLTYRLTDACGSELVSNSEGESTNDGVTRLRYSVLEPDTQAASGPPPYVCRIKKTSDYECDRSSACRLAREQTTSYDAYGNVSEVFDTAADAVHRRSNTRVFPNLQAYIVDRPAVQEEREFVGGSWEDPTRWPTLALVLYQYDDNTSHDVPPGTRGDLRAQLVWEPLEQGHIYRRTTFDYDVHGNVVKETRPSGAWQATSYDTTYALYPVASWNALFRTTREWDVVLGTMRSETDPNKQTISYTYDAYGRAIRTDHPDGTFHRTLYLASGVVGGPPGERQRTRTEWSDDSPTDGVLYQEFFFDGLGRTYRTVREGGTVHETRYADTSARPARVSHRYESGAPKVLWTSYAYDGLGRPTTITSPDGSVRRVDYPVGSTISIDELKHQRQLFHDGRGQTTIVREFDGTKEINTRYVYDGLGRLKGTTDHLGNVSSIEWDTHGRQRATVDPDRGRRTFTYLVDGHLETVRDAKGQTTRYSYDAIGRRDRREEIDPSGATTRTVTWRYDTLPDQATSGHSFGRLVVTTDAQGGGANSEIHRYDVMGRIDRLTKCVDQRCVEIGYGFDRAGRLQQTTYPDADGRLSASAEIVRYTYDEAGRLATVGDYVTLMAYDPDDQPTEITYGNGVVSTYTYDPARRWLASVRTAHVPTSAVHYQAEYTYDQSARIRRLRTTAERSTTDLTYTYDPLGRLTDVSSPDASRREAFRYDAIGRMIHSARHGTHEYQDPLHIHAATRTMNGASRRYDVNGNVERLTDPGGRDLQLRWTHDDRLSAVQDVARGTTVQFSYDVSGDRIKKHTSGSEPTLFFGALVELTNSRSVVKYYYAGADLIARRDASTVLYYHQDLNRSTVLQTNAAGEVVNRYAYTAYGTPVVSREGVSNDIGFAGHRSDDDTGLIYMNARY